MPMFTRLFSERHSAKPGLILGILFLTLLSVSPLAGQIVPRPIPRQRPAGQTDIYIVRFRPGVAASERAAIVQGAGAVLRNNYNVTNAVSVRVPNATVLSQLRNHPRVLGVFVNRAIKLHAAQGQGGGNANNKPKPPSNLIATPMSSSQISLAWTDDSDNEAGFKIERCTGSSCSDFAEIGQVGANATSFSNSGLAASTTYRYRVLAFNASGNSRYSNIAQATTQAAPTPPPAAPSNLTLAVASASQINLAWADNSTDESGFRVERCQGAAASCSSFAQVAEVGANVTGYNDTSLAAATTYTYRLRAFNAGGNSAYSNSAEATTSPAPTPPPAAPSNLTLSVASSSQINLAWADNSTDESGFRVERCQGAAASCSSFVQVAEVGPNVTGYNDTGLAAATTYTYRLRAYNANGNSAYSNSAEATTSAPPPPPPPSAPSNLTLLVASASQINLAWADNSGDESGFRVERCQGAAASCVSFVQVAQLGPNVTSHNDTNLTGGTTYTYRVRAFNGNGNSAYSNSAEATTSPAPPGSQVVPAGVQRIGAAPGSMTWTGAGVGVAVVDTGLDFGHPDLGLPPEVPGVNSFKAVGGGTCQDIHGHGTHVAGIVAARNNTIDVVGVAPQAALYCVNVFQPDPVYEVVATDESLVAGLEWIMANRNLVNPPIRVVNMSLGRERTPEDTPDHPLRVIVKALYDAGVSVVVSAGNDSAIEVSTQVPASFPEVMAIASASAVTGVNGYDEFFTACPGEQNILADTASYFTTDGAFVGGVGVTASAPGESQEDIFYYTGTCFVETIGILSTWPGGTAEASGTSMASPHVAGLVALMWQKELSLGGNLAPESARTRIRNSVARLGTAPLDSEVVGYTYDGQREGIVWAPAAVGDVPPPPQDFPPTVTINSPANGSTFSSGAVISFSGSATDPENGNLSASLIWTSNVSGQIGTGASFSRTLNAGVHTITASVTDPGGNVVRQSVSITVGSPSSATQVKVTSIVYWMQGANLLFTVELDNEFGGAVAGASVTAQLYEWLWGTGPWVSTGTTDAQGKVTFQLSNAPWGCYITQILDVQASGLTWDGLTPDNSFCN